jgi:antitoxin (DNA-binding transcriptional repressor) of toxin-antitoxin stability system
MARIDLDDLPLRIANTLAALGDGEEVLLVQGGAVVARLRAVVAPSEPAQPAPPPDVDMEEILEHFQSIIDDEF